MKTLLIAIVLAGSAFAQSQITALYYSGSPISFVAAGKTATLTPAAGYTFSETVGIHFYGVDTAPDYVYIEANNFPINEYWEVSFAVPQGTPLAPGTYLNATRYGFEDPTVPGLDFSGDSRGNDELTGFFTILEVSISNGKLLTFAADFTQYDGGAQASWNYGSVRINSSIPLNTLPPVPVGPLSVACTDAYGPTVFGGLYSYSSTCFAGGGVAPYQWAIVNGQLPAGLTLETTYPPGPGSVTISGQLKSPGPFNYTVQVTDSQNQIASQTFQGITANTSCTPSGVFRNLYQNYIFGPSGGSGILNFAFVSFGCPWTLTSDIPGVTFSQASGTTQGFTSSILAAFTAPPNTGATPQQGNLILQDSGVTVAMFPILINSSSCTYSINPSSAQFGSVGGPGTFTITPNPTNCYPFQVARNSPIPALDGGVYYYGLTPNTGAARTGTFQYAADPQSMSGPIATLSWTQDAGNGSLAVECYPLGAGHVGSPLVQCTAAGGTPPYTWSVNDGMVPGGFTQSSYSGASTTVGTGVAPGPYRFTVKIADSSVPAPAVATYTATGTVTPAAIQIVCTATSGPARSGVAYATGCIPVSGVPPYQWTITGGTLPPGLTITTLAGGGVSISGTPTATGPYSYTLQLADSSNPPLTITQPFSGTISSSTSPVTFGITCTTSITNFQIGVPTPPIACSAAGGNPPYLWSIQTGELPPGMVFNSTGSSITIVGPPTATAFEDFYVYLKVTDSSESPQSRLWQFTIQVYDQPSFSCSPPAGQVGQSYSSPCTGLDSTAWISAGNLPPGLGLSLALAPESIVGTPTTPGTYNFTLSIQPQAPPNSYYPNAITVSNSYTIVIGPALPPLNTSAASGALAQVAVGGGWQSTTVLVNPSATYARAHVGYLTDDGSAFAIPLVISLGGASATASSVDQVMPAHSRLTIDSNASVTSPITAGSAQVTVDGDVNGFIRFRYAPWDQDALVPMETRQAGAYTLSFDNTNGIATGVALENLMAVAATIPVVIRDNTGAQIGTASATLPAMGHSAFVLSDQFANTTNQTGTIEFDTPANGRISVLGLRFPPGVHFTTIPVIASTDPGGGALAHLAVGAGWQSTVELVNTGATSAQAHLSFFADDGTPLSLPLNIASALDQTLAPHQRVVIDSAALDGSSLLTGSAQLTTGGSVSGFIRFLYQPSNQEAIVPIDARNAGAYILAFDNLNGIATGVAVSNLTSADANIPVLIRDSLGNPIGSGSLDLAGNGHTSFVLSTNFPPAANQAGTIEFDAPPGGRISVLGLRFNLSGAFSTIPAVTP